MSYTNLQFKDTIVALATPAGVGAIGVIRLSGTEAIRIVNGVFKGKDLEKAASHTVHFGTIRTDAGQIIDEVLVTIFKTPRSYTKENVVEVSCHGSSYIIERLIALFIKKGARMAQAGEYTLRAFLNGQLDLSQAEAVADLIASDSQQSHQLAMRQMRGGFSDEIRKLRQELIHFASLIELELDFGEEDVEFANRDDLQQLIQKIQTLIRQLLDSFRLGNVLKKGVSTVLAGRPNAGKSTLLNALLNEERAIVSDIAGTTRDTIEEILNINGVQFRLIDTAGIREAQDQIEAVGVQKTMEKIQQSALLVYVFDVVATKIDEVLHDIQTLTQNTALYYIVVCNKMDTNPHYQTGWLTDPTQPDIPDFFFHNRPTETPDFVIPQENIVTLSALHKMNIPHLKEKLYEAVVHKKINADQAIVSNVRHYEALEHAYQSLDAALHGMQTGITSDFVAMDIRQALHHLGEITGEISTDDLLEKIFSSFCIGK